MPEAEVDLAALFNAVAKTLQENQASLNEADAYNHNHGDNMVKNFKVITKAMKQKQDADPADQLAYAGQTLRKSSSSGSAVLYADGLTRAADQLQGQSVVNEKNALSLVQALLGGQPTAGHTAPQAEQPSQAASGDMLGSLMGALLGGATGTQGSPPSSQPASGEMMGDLMGALLGGASGTQNTQTPQDEAGNVVGDLIGALLGGASGGTPEQASQDSQEAGGLNLGTLLTAGMAFFQAQQQGKSTMEALISAVMAGSQMNSTPHQSQSGQLVAGTLLNALGSMLGGKK